MHSQGGRANSVSLFAPRSTMFIERHVSLLSHSRTPQNRRMAPLQLPPANPLARALTFTTLSLRLGLQPRREQVQWIHQRIGHDRPERSSSRLGEGWLYRNRTQTRGESRKRCRIRGRMRQDALHGGPRWRPSTPELPIASTCPAFATKSNNLRMTSQ